MIIDPDFLDHWRTRLVVDSLGDELAPLYIMRIWAHCQVRKAVRFDGMSAAGLRSLCRYSGDPDRLEATLVEAGFVVRSGTSIEVPKWATHNAALICAWENGAKGGRPPKRHDNPPETGEKPTGSNGKPEANPNESDKTRGETMGDDGIGTIVNRSMGDGKTKVNGRRQPSSPSPINARGGGEERLDLSEVDWGKVVAMASAVSRKIPVKSGEDRRAWLKHAVVAYLYFNENWLMDSVEAVLQAKATLTSRHAHFIGVLRKKAEEQFHFDRAAFESMLGRIEIPPFIWKDKGVLEVKK